MRRRSPRNFAAAYAPDYTFIDHVKALLGYGGCAYGPSLHLRSLLGVEPRCRYTALPTKAPIPAVKAIARAPQNTTLIVGRRIAAPPVLAPIMPSKARKTNEPIETVGISHADGERSVRTRGAAIAFASVAACEVCAASVIDAHRSKRPALAVLGSTDDDPKLCARGARAHADGAGGDHR